MDTLTRMFASFNSHNNLKRNIKLVIILFLIFLIHKELTAQSRNASFSKDGINAVNCFSLGVLALEENEKPKSLLSIYPNPSSGILKIHLFEPATAIRVFNSLGVILNEVTFSGIDQKTISMPYQNGLYFIEVVFVNGQKASRKVILKNE